MRAKGNSVADDDQKKQQYFEAGKILVAPGHTYRVTGLLGEGGMGRVYGGIDRDTYMEVAIKILFDEHARERGDIYDRFCRESRIPGLISNRIKDRSTRVVTKHLLRPTAIGELSDGAPYYAMTRLSGGTVQQQILSAGTSARKYGRKPGLPVISALNIAIGLLFSLEALHQCGVVHRDIKPANIFLHESPGEDATAVVLLDYGIAHLMDEGSRTTVAGTAGYIAPEHFTREIGPPADIFAVGVLLFGMIAGMKPANCMKSAWPVAGETRKAPSLALFGVVPALTAVVSRCLDLDPRKRPTAVELYLLLQDISNALPEFDVGTAVTEDPIDPNDRAAGDSSTGISLADCSPATSPDLDVTDRMHALRAMNDRRAALGLPPVMHLPNNETTPMAGRPIILGAAPPEVRAAGPRQKTVPMGRGLVSPPAPMLAMPTDVVTIPPTSSSPSPLGPMSQPEYAPESVPKQVADPILARLPDRHLLAEALRHAVQTRDHDANGSATRADGAPSPATSGHSSSMTAVALLPRVTPQWFERFLATLRERRRGLAAGRAARQERASRERAKQAAARELAKELAAQMRGELELADKQRQVEDNRRQRREAEARGESWTEKSQPRLSSLRSPVAVAGWALAAIGLALIGVLVVKVLVRRNAPRSLGGAPTAVVAAATSSRSEGAETESAPPPDAPSVVVAPAALPATAVTALAPEPRPQASAARASGARKAIKAAPVPTSTNRPVMPDFE